VSHLETEKQNLPALGGGKSGGKVGPNFSEKVFAACTTPVQVVHLTYQLAEATTAVLPA
jgi:hypothetical protein